MGKVRLFVVSAPVPAPTLRMPLPVLRRKPEMLLPINRTLATLRREHVAVTAEEMRRLLPLIEEQVPVFLSGEEAELLTMRMRGVLDNGVAHAVMVWFEVEMRGARYQLRLSPDRRTKVQIGRMVTEHLRRLIREE